MAEASIREQIARVRAASVSERRVELFQPHETLGALEAVIRCMSCRRDVAVGPSFDHIVKEEFVCGSCLESGDGVETLTLDELSETLETDEMGGASDAARLVAGKAGKSQESGS